MSLSIVICNDYLTGINGEEVMWTFLVKHLNEKPDVDCIGVDCNTVGTNYRNRKFHTLFAKHIAQNIKIIIQNATFMGTVDPNRFTIMYLQDNLRKMNRRNPQQEANLKQAKKLVTNSRITAASYPEYNFEIIPIGVNHNLFAPKDKTGYFEYSKVGIFVGAFNEVKGWSHIKQIILKRSDVFFILVSKYNDNPQLNVPNIAIFNQINQEQLSQLLNCADFFILGSPVETQCLAAIEACLCNIPIIMHPTGIFMDMTQDDRNHIGYFDKNDLEPYIDKICFNKQKFTPRQTVIKYGLTIDGMINKWYQLIKNINATN